MLQAFLLQCVLFCPAFVQKKKLYIPVHIHTEVVIRPSKMSNLFALRRMLFITARHIHVPTGFDLPITFSTLFLLKPVLFSYLL